MIWNAEARFVSDAENLKKRIEAGRLKRPELIECKIGALRQKHPRVARYYQTAHKGKSLRVTRHDERIEQAKSQCGQYDLKTDQQNDAESLWEAVRQGALGRQQVFDVMAKQFLPGRFDPPDFALNLARKDVALACEVGREYDVPMRISHLVLSEMTEAINKGNGARDSRSMLLLQEERAGVEVRVPQERLDAIMGKKS